MPGTKPKPSREKMRRHRENLRRQDLRAIQVWVPDFCSQAFKAQAHQQSLATARGENERKDQAFIDAVADQEE